MENNSSFGIKILTPLLLNIEIFSDKNAFFINEEPYSYGQLGECISKIREEIRYLPTSDKYFGLVTNDDIETYSSIFALWLEGKSYIPLHPNQPFGRLNEIIEDMGIDYILDSDPQTIFSGYRVINTSNLLSIDEFRNDYNEYSDNELAYVLFTSGSTGKPKGVMISRENIASFVDSFSDCGIALSSTDKCLQCFDLTFDVSVQSFLIPLLHGASVYTIPNNEIKYSYASALLEDHQLTLAAMAPSMLRYLRPYFDEINLPHLRYCILTAEASPELLAKEWSECIPNAEIYNFYGPTEATIYCTFYKINFKEGNKTLNGMLSIGKPMKNVFAIIIDEQNNIVSNGEKGELCVAGNQICPGYWNDSGKNKTAFFIKQYKGDTVRFYRTGDLCFKDQDSNLLLYGRLDSQAKIQGYRVELGEIEFHAREFLNGTNVACLVYSNRKGNTELALFVENNQVSEHELLNYLKSKLPHYMIPSSVFLEEEFPLNANSKVDKKKLKEKLSF